MNFAVTGSVYVLGFKKIGNLELCNVVKSRKNKECAHRFNSHDLWFHLNLFAGSQLWLLLQV